MHSNERALRASTLGSGQMLYRRHFQDLGLKTGRMAQDAPSSPFWQEKPDLVNLHLLEFFSTPAVGGRNIPPCSYRAFWN